MTKIVDQWAAGSIYDNFMGRWSRLLALKFVPWLQLSRGAHWLDAGCGTGAMVEAICDKALPGSVLGCDPARPFIEFAQQHNHDERASFEVAGVDNLPKRAGGYDCVSSLFALNFFPDAQAALQEMIKVASREATVAACVWDYREGMELLRFFWDAAVAIDPAAAELDEGKRFPLCQQDTLLALFHKSELKNVRCEPLEISTGFVNFDDYWQPFLGGTGPAPSYVAALSDDLRTALAQQLKETLPSGPNGTIPLTARAWAVAGLV